MKEYEVYFVDIDRKISDLFFDCYNIVKTEPTKKNISYLSFKKADFIDKYPYVSPIIPNVIEVTLSKSSGFFVINVYYTVQGGTIESGLFGAVSYKIKNTGITYESMDETGRMHRGTLSNDMLW